MSTTITTNPSRSLVSLSAGKDRAIARAKKRMSVPYKNPCTGGILNLVGEHAGDTDEFLAQQKAKTTEKPPTSLVVAVADSVAKETGLSVNLDENGEIKAKVGYSKEDLLELFEDCLATIG